MSPQLKIEHVLIPRLKGALYNPREIAPRIMQRLKNSIREFGFVEPIVARREDLLIVGGHQRVQARVEIARENKEAIEHVSIPVVFVDGLDDRRARLLNLALNKIVGDWDYDKLADMMRGLKEGGDDLELTGFSVAEIDDLIAMTQIGSDLGDGGVMAEDLDDALDRRARSFSFELRTAEDAELCREVLATYGMTGPGDASDAFLKAMKAAKKRARKRDADHEAS